MAKIYALYKGDEYITDGTLRELSKKTGKKEATLKFMTTPSYEGRIGEKALRLVCLGEEYYKKCVVCGKEFRVTALQKSRLYCSDTCKRKVKRERDRRAAAAKRKRKPTFASLPESERTRECPACGKMFVAEKSNQRYCSKRCSSNGGGYRGTMLDLPPKKRRYESHIEEINAQARAQHKSYGQLQAEKLLARLHAEMNGVRA